MTELMGKSGKRRYKKKYGLYSPGSGSEVTVISY